MSISDLKKSYIDITEKIKGEYDHSEAMEQTVGGKFDIIGPIEVGIVQSFGLRPDGYLIDVGCGSGRLAIPLSYSHEGRYLGIDLVPDLLDHARSKVDRDGWAFKEIDHIEIPESDNQADMVCFFSVMTHLLHEQTYWYLEEAARVLKPGGKIVFSFLEYDEPGHVEIFKKSIERHKEGEKHVLIVFNDRASIASWASDLGLTVESFHRATEAITDAGALGQAICVLRKS